jgi:hypothetical protein
MVHPVATNGGKGHRCRPQPADRGYLGMPEPAKWALMWVLVAACIIGPWGLLGLFLWWLSGALMGI